MKHLKKQWSVVVVMKTDGSFEAITPIDQDGNLKTKHEAEIFAKRSEASNQVILAKKRK